MQTCETCVFSQSFPEPGASPVKPQPPVGWLRRLFWSDPAADIWSGYNFDLRRHRNATEWHEQLVYCNRFPETVEKHKSDTCGEHKERTSDD